MTNTESSIGAFLKNRYLCIKLLYKVSYSGNFIKLSLKKSKIVMKIKSASLLVLLCIGLITSAFSQSQDQNYVKETEYLETVVLHSDFLSSFGGWLQNGSVNFSLDNGRVRANVNSSWEGLRHELTSLNVNSGENYTVHITFDKANTASSVRFYFQELDANGNHIRYAMLNANLSTGSSQYNYTVGSGTKKLFLRIDKDNTNTSSETHFFVDHVSMVADTGNSSIDKIENIMYSDGFGKTKQIVAKKQTPMQNDIVQHVEYDEFGRSVKRFLPYPSTQNTGDFVNNGSTATLSYYQTEFSDQHPFSEVRYENSPLNRELEVSAPGNTWQLLSSSDADHTTKYEDNYNGLQEVLKFEIDDTNPTNPLIVSHYAEMELFKSIVKNENWTTSDGLLNTMEIFTDKNGRTIAEFNYVDNAGNTDTLRTYYVYDDQGNLRYVLPPKMFPQSVGANYSNYSASWPFNDFVTPSYSGSLNFGILNNVLTINYLIVSPQIYAPRTLNLQTTKILNVTPTLPDMYLGKIMVVGKGFSGEVGEASIVNGNLVIDRTSTAQFGDFDGSMSISVNLASSLSFSQSDLDKLAFQYKYDSFYRQIEQKVPGREWEYIIYDRLDRPILTQDGNLRENDEWMFTKYDAYSRPVYAGLYASTSTRAALQTAADNAINASSNKSNIVTRTVGTNNIGGASINYSNDAFPTTGLDVLTVQYYDNYTFTDLDKPATPTQIQGQDVTTRTQGLLTATWSKVLGSLSSWEKSYNYYDEKGSVIYNYEKNHLGGNTQVEWKLDFRGKASIVETTHRRLASSTPITITDRFEYDTTERMVKQYQFIGAHEELIAEKSYNELGELEQKGVGGYPLSPRLQTVDYTYNIRGWLSTINDVNSLGTDLFSYNLRYDEAIVGTSSVDNIYDGNIKQVIWRSAHNNLKKSYTFQYDEMDRFTRSYYRENNSLNGGAGKYETGQLSYDENGNITELRRWDTSSIPIDDLDYHYINGGNQLGGIVDGNAPGMENGFFNGNTGTSQSDYQYDDNGNLTRDLNKGISNIAYNHLDLVETVQFFNGDKIEFTYDANGDKLQMITDPAFGVSTTIDYIGAFQYSNGNLQFFQHSEGYVLPASGNYDYVYIHRDHLGNNRVSYSDLNNDGDIDILNGEIVSSTDYYVMGLTHTGGLSTGTSSGYNYKYNGKEEISFANYNMYDFGSRMYDPSVGRWFNTDPQNQFQSPYLAMGNNGMMMLDPDGELAFETMVLISMALSGTIAAVSTAINGGDIGQVIGSFIAASAESGVKSAATLGLLYGLEGVVAGKGFIKAIQAKTWSGKAAAKADAAAKAAESAERIAAGVTGETIQAAAPSTVGRAAEAGFSRAAGGFFQNVFTKASVKGGLNSAIINTLSSFKKDQDIGWQNLGAFGAGFVGGVVGGGANSKVVGGLVSGGLTRGINGGKNSYERNQNFVKGFLAAYNGLDGKVSTQKLFKGDSFFQKGIEATAFDFAHTKKKDYKQRKWNALTMFIFNGVAGGFTKSKVFKQKANTFDKIAYGSSVWLMNGAIKNNFKSIKTNKSQLNKAGITIFKDFFKFK
jgi:RHS repeat-associated protein